MKDDNMLLKELIFDENTGYNYLKWPKLSLADFSTYPSQHYLFKVNYRNTRKRYEICSKLTIKTPKRRLTLNTFHTFSSVSIFDLDLVNVC